MELPECSGDRTQVIRLITVKPHCEIHSQMVIPWEVFLLYNSNVEKPRNDLAVKSEIFTNMVKITRRLLRNVIKIINLV